MNVAASPIAITCIGNYFAIFAGFCIVVDSNAFCGIYFYISASSRNSTAVYDNIILAGIDIYIAAGSGNTAAVYDNFILVSIDFYIATLGRNSTCNLQLICCIALRFILRISQFYATSCGGNLMSTEI